MGAENLADNLMMKRAKLDSDGSSLMLFSFRKIRCFGEERNIS